MAEQPNNTTPPAENTGVQTTQPEVTQKNTEVNPLAVVFQQIWAVINTRFAYILIGGVALLLAVFLFWNWFKSSQDIASSGASRALDRADTIKALEELQAQYKKEPTGIAARFHQIRYLLYTEGFEKLGDFNTQEQEKALKNIAEARKLSLALVPDINKKKDKGLLQEAYLNAARAEKALIGAPAGVGSGSADQAASYFEEAAKIFPDTELAKTYNKEAADIRANAEQIAKVQSALYTRKNAGLPSIPGTDIPKLPSIPGFPTFPKDDIPIIPGLK